MADILVSASNLNVLGVGEVVDVQPLSTMALPPRDPRPNKIYVVIIDTTREQDYALFKPWLTEYLHTVQSENPTRFSMRSRVHPNSISASGEGAEDRFDDMMDWAEETYNCTQINQSPTLLNYNLPKPVTRTLNGIVTVVDLATFEADYADVFNHYHEDRQFVFSQVTVDAGLNGTGTVTMTGAEAQADVVDKLTL